MPTRSRTYIARRRPIELQAHCAKSEHKVDTWEGPRTAYPGDYIMTGIKGEQWPVPNDKFKKLYEIMSPADDTGIMWVRKRIMEMAVFQVYYSVRFRIAGEDFNADPGYFIVAHPDGSYYPCDPDVFFETFEVVRPAEDHETFVVEFFSPAGSRFWTRFKHKLGL